MNELQLVGSRTARNGFINEAHIVDKFNNWHSDSEAQKWLTLMGYTLVDIDFVKAVVLHGYKADINVQITINRTYS